MRSRVGRFVLPRVSAEKRGEAPHRFGVGPLIHFNRKLKGKQYDIQSIVLNAVHPHFRGEHTLAG